MGIGWLAGASLLVPAMAGTGASAHAADDFKGPSVPDVVSVGGMTGLAVIDSRAAFTVLGHAARKILDRGFVNDLNDSVWIEGEAGPAFTSGSTAFVYSLHLRWDFVKDATWTFYALAGLGGDVTPAGLGDHFELFPRFGVGAMLHLLENLSLRAELSHELIVAGVQFGF